MKPLYNEKDFVIAKTNILFPLECYVCNASFFRNKKLINRCIKGAGGILLKYCSKKCQVSEQIKQEKVFCLNCNIEFLKKKSQIKLSIKHFCNPKCHLTFYNKNKTIGIRRSKLEKYIEEQLSIIYPELIIEYNKTKAIQSEIDIFIPSLRIAFELNGIFHYNPIYGVDKLMKIRVNDEIKSKACQKAKIDLYVIDTSKQKRVNPLTSQKYLDFIINIIKPNIIP